MIKVLFFASLRDQLGTGELQLVSDNNGDLTSLRENLKRKGEPWSTSLANKHLMVAVNQAMTTGNCLLQDGDEVAFFPAVTGG